MRAYLVPHVPFMIPELGGTKFKKYIEEILEKFKEIRDDFHKEPPEAILICSSHYSGNVFKVGMAKEYRGSFRNFQRPDVIDVRKGHLELANHIQTKAEEIGFLTSNEVEELGGIDYGTQVPLKFIDPEAHIPIVPISVSLGSKKEHFIWGQKLFDIVKDFSDNIAFIASTELTQDMQQDPRAYPINSDKDVRFSQAIIEGNFETMSAMPEEYFEKTEGLLPTFILAGFGTKMKGNLSLYTGFVGCGISFLDFQN